MRPESLGATIERAFGGLTPPPIEQLAADVQFVADYVVEAVRSKTWEELRPLKRYFPEGQILVILSARTFQYYLPAFLFALVEGEDGERYLNPVLESLGYAYSQESFERAHSWFRSPAGGWQELMPEMQQLLPCLTDDERRMEAQRRVDIALQMAELAKTKGVDWGYGSYSSSANSRFVQRVASLTEQQKRCIALSLVHISERSPDLSDVHRVQATLDRHWRSFLPRAGEASDDPPR
jgi:hypothetical protein